MEKIDLPVHEHPLLPFTRFSDGPCKGCGSHGSIYGGYRCNEFGCEGVVFHTECAKLLPEILHSFHPDHPLKLTSGICLSTCSRCGAFLTKGYYYLCSICDNFKLDVPCVSVEKAPLLSLENPNLHEHPLDLICQWMKPDKTWVNNFCKKCDHPILSDESGYTCYQCELSFHVECVKFSPEANHTSHPKHSLKLLTLEASPDYADKKCLLCGMDFRIKLHHCDVCNVSICSGCMSNPPPLDVVSPTTHEHQLYLVPRCIVFTCNACGEQGDRSPYFCLQCNFMIHRECIDLPRVINVNRHDHRISYTRRLGHGAWKCGVCRKKVDGFYGAYSCSKCSNYVVHSRCETRKDVWDMIELEGTVEEPEEPPFVVIDDNTIKHFSHDHDLRVNKDGRILEESVVCEACVFHVVGSETFYSCEQCDFILHQKCANLPRKKRHVSHNQLLTLDTKSECKAFECQLCKQWFTGFRYQTGSWSNAITLDVRCASFSEPFFHESHPHPLYYSKGFNTSYCTACRNQNDRGCFICDECDYFYLDFKCAFLPQKVMRYRYDDHPLFLSSGDSNVYGKDYLCEVCETILDPRKCFYTCNACGITLHISCLVGDFSYFKQGTVTYWGKVVPNTSICRPLCTYVCSLRCAFAVTD